MLPKKTGNWDDKWKRPSGYNGHAWESWPPTRDNGKPNLEEWFPKKPRGSDRILHPELDDAEYVRGFHVTALIYGKRSHCVYEAGGFCTSKAPSQGGARQGWRTVQGAPSDWYKVWKMWCDSRNLRVARPPPWLQRTVGTQTGDVEELSPTTSDAGSQTSGPPGASTDNVGQQEAGAAKAADSARRPPPGSAPTTPNDDGRRPKRSRTDPTDLIDLASSSDDKKDDKDKRGLRPWRGVARDNTRNDPLPKKDADDANSNSGPRPKDDKAKKDNTNSGSDPPPRKGADDDARPDPGAINKDEEGRRPDDDAAPTVQPGSRPRRRGCRSGRKVREREGRPTPLPSYFKADPSTSTPYGNTGSGGRLQGWSYDRSMGSPRSAQDYRAQQAGPSGSGGFRQGGWGPMRAPPANQACRSNWGPGLQPGTPGSDGGQPAPSRGAGQGAAAPRNNEEWRRFQEWRREEEEGLFQQWRERGGSKGDRR